jgi:carbon-monoxide dehydrogenase small subunit
VKVTITVNGSQVEAEVPDRTLLVHFLREQAGLTATNVGCDTSSCGACTVLLDGQSVKSCTLLAAQADSRAVQTVEGLASGDGPDAMHPVQRAFRAEHGLQCGFCTPGFLTTITAGLRANPEPTEPEAREMIAGNLCRCTGYANIVKSVLRAAEIAEERR